MKIIKFIGKIWELISRFARVLVKLDDMFIEMSAFWEWLTGDDELDEPEEPEIKSKNAKTKR